jgi:hypothetical protein
MSRNAFVHFGQCTVKLHAIVRAQQNAFSFLNLVVVKHLFQLMSFTMILHQFLLC